MDAYLQRQICARIKQARVEAGFTQEEMADLLHITMRAYQNYEKDRVPFRKLDSIAEIAGKTQEWLLRGNPPEPTPPPSFDLEHRLEVLSAAAEDLQAAAAEALPVLKAIETRLARVEAALGLQEASGRRTRSG